MTLGFHVHFFGCMSDIETAGVIVLGYFPAFASFLQIVFGNVFFDKFVQLLAVS